MKKYLIIVLIIIITIICTIFISNMFKKEIFTPIVYQTCTNSNISNETVIEANKLKIALKGFYKGEVNNEQILPLNFDEETNNNILKFSEGKAYNLLIDFSNIDGEKISEPIFDYFIYDNLGNIIFTSMIYKRDATETNNFLKYFMKKEHNSNDITSLSNYIVSGGSTINVVNNAEASNLILISSSDGDYVQKELDLSKIYVLILNPSYKINGKNERIYNENTIYEFILEN